LLSDVIQEEEDVEKFDFVEAFKNDIFEDDDFDDLSDMEHVHSCSNYFID